MSGPATRGAWPRGADQKRRRKVGGKGRSMTATIEVLEGRTLLAAAPAGFVYSGNVTARVEDGWLVVQGDAAANELRILSYIVPYSYLVDFQGYTTINGREVHAVFDGVTRGVRVHGRRGRPALGEGPGPRAEGGGGGGGRGLIEANTTTSAS